MYDRTIVGIVRSDKRTFGLCGHSSLLYINIFCEHCKGCLPDTEVPLFCRYLPAGCKTPKKCSKTNEILKIKPCVWVLSRGLFQVLYWSPLIRKGHLPWIVAIVWLGNLVRLQNTTYEMYFKNFIIVKFRATTQQRYSNRGHMCILWLSSFADSTPFISWGWVFLKQARVLSRGN